MTDKDAIVKLIKILAKPHDMLVFRFQVAGHMFDGIRVQEIDKFDYEIFRELPFMVEDSAAEEVFYSCEIDAEYEEHIKKLLESFL